MATRTATRELTDAQRSLLEYAVDNDGKFSTGRGGGRGTSATARSLEKRGFVVMLREHTWESDWAVTTRGLAELERNRK